MAYLTVPYHFSSSLRRAREIKDTLNQDMVTFEKNTNRIQTYSDRLCGLVVRDPDYKSGGPGSILSATIFSEM
jgi:hypothetical protein